MDKKEIADQIRDIMSKLPKQENRTRMTPFFDRRTYLGKLRHVVGYWYCRPGSNPRSGVTYDCILGYGDTIEEAIAKAKEKI